MEFEQNKYRAYVQILKEELVPAFGCTEPIAIAYCAAKATEVLGARPQRVDILASGNIIKNVKSVIVPNTGGLKGIPAAAAAGIVGGKPEKKLEVIAEITEEQKQEMRRYLEQTPFDIKALSEGEKLDILIRAKADGHEAKVRIAKTHCNIVLIEKDGEILYEDRMAAPEEAKADQEREAKEAPDKTENAAKEAVAKTENAAKETTDQTENAAEETADQTENAVSADRNLLNVSDIIRFADCVAIDDVKETLDRQISCNTRIAVEGMKNSWGANIGSTLIKMFGDDVKIRCKALAAAGSDARMSGCELPVVINSGSGNQGITVSVPVIVYADELGSTKEQLYRALVISNLIAVHIKHGIGPLSAFCGAVSAGCAAGCAIAYLHGGKEKEIAHTLVNSLATVSGIFCDGAKASCAAKIAASVEAGILGYFMYENGQQFYAEDGIVSKGVENTIKNICRLGANGMNETDEEIIKIMTHCD